MNVCVSFSPEWPFSRPQSANALGLMAHPGTSATAVGRGPASRAAGMSKGLQGPRGREHQHVGAPAQPTPCAVSKTSSLPLSEGPPGGTPEGPRPRRSVRPLRAPSPSRPQQAAGPPSPWQPPGYAPFPSQAQPLGLVRAIAEGPGPIPSGHPLRNPTDAFLSVARPLKGEARGILGVVVCAPLTCRDQGNRGR